MSENPTDPQIHRLRVTNRNNFTIRDRYDGVPYVFAPNDPVDISIEAARHLLGYPGDPDEMALHQAKRWGWNRPEHVKIDPITGLMKFQEFSINMDVQLETFEIRRVESNVSTRIDDTPGMTESETEEARSSRGSKKYNLPTASGARS